MFPTPTFWAPTLRLQLGDVEHVQSAQGGVIYIVVYGTAGELRHRHCTLAPDTGNAGSYEAASSGGYLVPGTYKSATSALCLYMRVRVLPSLLYEYVQNAKNSIRRSVLVLTADVFHFL